MTGFIKPLAGNTMKKREEINASERYLITSVIFTITMISLQ